MWSTRAGLPDCRAYLAPVYEVLAEKRAGAFQTYREEVPAGIELKDLNPKASLYLIKLVNIFK